MSEAIKVHWWQEDDGWYYSTPDPVGTEGGPFPSRKQAQEAGYADILKALQPKAAPATPKKAAK